MRCDCDPCLYSRVAKHRTFLLLLVSFTWGSKLNNSEQTWLLSVRHRPCWACSRLSHCSLIRDRLTRKFLYVGPLGMPNPRPPFAAVALVRSQVLRHAYFSLSHIDYDLVQIPHPLFECLADTFCYAARVDKVQVTSPLISKLRATSSSRVCFGVWASY
jgi:hypothetical protein